ncbi:DUF4240 domain-containing protein [Asanoa sp. NPDC050611]|uniref:DUF4240 domain-containing protein n=1 Tax=Asanoa sp. NPDC050611 TaxID=3157098 RepID=UPI0033E5A361
MLTSEFWSLVEGARADAGEPSSAAVGAALVDRLAGLPPAGLLEFDECYSRATGRADQWGLCAAAYLIWDHLSDDAFMDFKGGLVGLGQEAFERAVADADSLADHPTIQAIAARRIEPFTLSGEAIGSAAARAYTNRTGDDDAFWEALDAYEPTRQEADEPAGEAWDGRFGGAGDVARIPSRLPRLHALFRPAAATATR